jgi:hypothetical protein
MTWQEIITSALSVLITGCLIPLANAWVRRHIKDARLAQFAAGAISAAGRAVLEVDRLRAEKGLSLEQAAQMAVREEAASFFQLHRDNFEALGANLADAEARVRGELGVLLASQPGAQSSPPRV